MAVFISFEGGEGSGKSTQAEVLTERLTNAGVAVEFVHEPGTTELGWQIRDILKRGLPGESVISAEAELLLFSAARAQLVLAALRPLQDRADTVVVADRYVDSTTAYQGYGRGIPMEQVEVVNALATQGIMPDLTFLLDLPPMNGLTRIGESSAWAFASMTACFTRTKPGLMRARASRTSRWSFTSACGGAIASWRRANRSGFA